MSIFSFPTHKEKGFSLIELSIVLVILGLLATGVLAGGALVSAAQRQAIIREINEYRIAISAFVAKYDELPGDSPQITKYFSTTAGNGDGEIGGIAGTNKLENFLVWEHLSLAGVTNGKYQGNTITTANVSSAVRGVNMPASKVKAGTYNIDYTRFGGRYPGIAPDSGNNMLIYMQYAGFNTSPGYFFTLGPAATVIAPSDAFAIDKKMDDGTANTGNVKGDSGSTTILCRNATTGAYLVQDPYNDSCYLGFGLEY